MVCYLAMTLWLALCCNLQDNQAFVAMDTHCGPVFTTKTTLHVTCIIRGVIITWSHWLTNLFVIVPSSVLWVNFFVA